MIFGMSFLFSTCCGSRNLVAELCHCSSQKPPTDLCSEKELLCGVRGWLCCFVKPSCCWKAVSCCPHTPVCRRPGSGFSGQHVCFGVISHFSLSCGQVSGQTCSAEGLLQVHTVTSALRGAVVVPRAQQTALVGVQCFLLGV